VDVVWKPDVHKAAKRENKETPAERFVLTFVYMYNCIYSVFVPIFNFKRGNRLFSTNIGGG